MEVKYFISVWLPSLVDQTEPSYENRTIDFPEIKNEADIESLKEKCIEIFSNSKVVLLNFILIGYQGVQQSAVEEILDTPLTSRKFDLSPRSVNCLKSADICTLRDLASYELRDIRCIRNLGKKSVAEIQDLMQKHNVSFA